jgi:hypothetical protein
MRRSEPELAFYADAWRFLAWRRLPAEISLSVVRSANKHRSNVIEISSNFQTVSDNTVKTAASTLNRSTGASDKSRRRPEHYVEEEICLSFKGGADRRRTFNRRTRHP